MKKPLLPLLLIISLPASAAAQSAPPLLQITITIGEPTAFTPPPPQPPQSPTVTEPQLPLAPALAPPLLDPELNRPPQFEPVPMRSFAPGYDRGQTLRRTYPDYGGPVPPGFLRQTHLNRGLALTGVLVSGVPYALTALGGALCALARCRDPGLAFVPVIGPWIIATTGNNSETYTLLLVLDGLFQAGGLAIMIGGLASHRSVLVPAQYAQARSKPPMTWSVLPMASPSTAGLAFAAAF